MSLVKEFLRVERGAASLDWIVLTAVIVLTGLSVMGSVSGGMENASVETALGLRGQVVRQAFISPDCAAGVDGLRAREMARITAGGSDPVDVDAMMQVLASFDDSSLRAEQARTARDLDLNEWTRDHTVAGAVDCAAAARGLE